MADIQYILVELYDDATRCVQVMPLEEEGVPLSEIYGTVLVEEDLTALKKTRRANEPTGNKIIKNIEDMFYVTASKDGKLVKKTLAKRIFLKGEAGYGKTVLCLKLVQTWSKSKQLCGESGDKFSPRSMEKENKNGSRKMQGNGSSENFCSSLSTNSQSRIQQRVHVCVPPVEDKEMSQQEHDILIKDEKDKDEDRKLQSLLKDFDAVFYIPLRDAKDEASSVVDLVCNTMSDQTDASKQKIRQLLGDDNIPCMVVLDGLDEWNVPAKCKDRGFPGTHGLVNCVLLCSMRPWRMVNLRLGLDSKYDKVVEILGLEGDSVAQVIRNVLLYFYGMESRSGEYRNTLKEYCLKAKQTEMKSLLKIPLMLTASCVVWKEESDKAFNNQVALYFMTQFYLKLTEIKISRSAIKDIEVRSYLCGTREHSEPLQHMPVILSDFKNIIDFLDVIKPVGKLALKDLVSEETHLVFPKANLERDIGQRTVRLALRVGILSQSKAPGLSYQQRVSVSFFHKSVQEFISALTIACGDADAMTLFLTNCITVDKAMELSNMITFVCGLDPEKGCELSAHVFKLVSSENEIIRYREKPLSNQVHFGNISSHASRKVKELNKVHVRWFSEMKQNPSYTENIGHQLIFTVTDLYVDRSSNRDMVSMTTGCENTNISSICLTPSLNSPSNIIQDLPLCKCLTSLYIVGFIQSTDCIQMLASVLPHMEQLEHVLYSGQWRTVDDLVVDALQQLTTLKCLELMNVLLNDTFSLTGLPLLETVVLHHVEDAPNVLSIVCKCSSLKYVELWNITLHDARQVSESIETVVLHNIRNPHYILRCCNSLRTLQISNLSDEKDQMMLADALSQLKYLQYIRYSSVSLGKKLRYLPGDLAIIGALHKLDTLQCIHLREVHLSFLLVSPSMTELREIKLESVHMNVRGWGEFLKSLAIVQNVVNVTLDTYTDDISVSLIRRYSYCAITEKRKTSSDRIHIEFYAAPQSRGPISV